MRRSGCASIAERFDEEGQAAVHPVINAGMIVAELFIGVRDARLLKQAVHAPRAIDQIVLIDIAAIDEEAFEALEILRTLGRNR